MDKLILFIVTIIAASTLSASAYAGCMTQAKADFAEASAKFKAKQLTHAQYDLERSAYVNAQYVCRLISPAKFCRQEIALANQALEDTSKDYPESPERDAVVCKISQLKGDLLSNCGHPEWGALTSEVGCMPRLQTGSN